MRVAVMATAGAREPRLERLEDGSFRVAVRERAQEGEANRAIEAALARHFGVARTRVRVVSGHAGRRKLVAIEL